MRKRAVLPIAALILASACGDGPTAPAAPDGPQFHHITADGFHITVNGTTADISWDWELISNGNVVAPTGDDSFVRFFTCTSSSPTSCSATAAFTSADLGGVGTTYQRTNTPAGFHRVRVLHKHGSQDTTFSNPSPVFEIVAGPTTLVFTSAPFTGVVGQCLGPLNIQTRNASDVATNVAASTSVSLATDGTGAFYSDSGCSSSSASVTINSGSNSASFYYKATARGTGVHELTAAASGLTSAKQTQTINRANTQTSITSVSPNPAILGQEVTVNFAVSVQSPGSGTPTGTVSVYRGSVSLSNLLCSGSSAGGSCNYTPAAVGSLSLVARYAGDDDFNGSTTTSAVSQQTTYNFIGFTSPVDNPNVLNVAKAGQAVPLKWRLLDAAGNPVTDLSSVSVTVASLSCTLSTTTDGLEEYAAGASGLQNLGDGYYQFNWKSPTSYANSCKTLNLNLGEGSPRTALFKFTK